MKNMTNKVLLNNTDESNSISDSDIRDFIEDITDAYGESIEFVGYLLEVEPEEIEKMQNNFDKVAAGVSVASLAHKVAKKEDTLDDWTGTIEALSALTPYAPAVSTYVATHAVLSYLLDGAGEALARAITNKMGLGELKDPNTGEPINFPRDLRGDPGEASDPTRPISNPESPEVNPPPPADPIVLDLDGDGVETLSLLDRVFFDHDGNHFAENTGWVGADDGLLVMDKDGDGVIKTGEELFGNHTHLQDGTLAKNGYIALQEQDSNQDGIINNLDTSWQKLNVWQDRNGNARVDSGELLTLEEAGIAAIETNYKNSRVVDEQGNAHSQTGKIAMIDGSIHQSADVWFETDHGYTRYDESVVITHDIMELPYIRGFGNMPDLYVAMSKNAELKDLVQRYSANPMSKDSDALLEQIIFTWSGVTNVATGSRGSYIDARHLAAIEAASGDVFKNGANPLSNDAAFLEKEYQRFASYIEAEFLSQTYYSEDFAFIKLQIKSDLSGLAYNFDAFEAHLVHLKNTHSEKYLHVSNVFYDRLEYSPAFVNIRERLGISEENTFIGGSSNEVLTGGDGSDSLYGDAGDDALSGSYGDDLLAGGTGKDTLKGGYGSDTYQFNAGDGQDTVTDSGAYATDTDILRFGEGLLAENAVVQRSGQNLVVSFRDSTDSVTVAGYFSGSWNEVEQLVFADGTVWDAATVKAMTLAGTDAAQSLVAGREGSEIHAAGGNDTLTGDNGNDSLYGDAGDDALSGSYGDDLLAGGTGKDTLKGGYGSDTYQFNAGDGQDTVTDSGAYATDTDILRFGEGLLAESAVLKRSANDLIVSFRDSTDSVKVADYFYSGRFQVEHITFADGTDWLPQDIFSHLEDGIPLPLAAPADAPVSISLMRQQMAMFTAGEDGDEEAEGLVSSLSTSRTTVQSLVNY